MLLAPSSVTTREAPRVSVLKSAVLPLPEAMVPPLQLAPAAQLPPSTFVYVETIPLVKMFNAATELVMEPYELVMMTA